MNRINKILEEKNNILSIYFTAGFPEIEDTEKIILKLSECDVDMVEIGLPFSDPLADGPTIQESSTIALNNGMNTKKLFIQLKNIRKKTNIPLIIMGYFNPILQFGIENFCEFPNSISEGETFRFRINNNQNLNCAQCLAYTPMPKKYLSISVVD